MKLKPNIDQYYDKFKMDYFYYNDKWDLINHKLYAQLPSNKKNKITSGSVINFNKCINENLKIELKYYFSELIEKEKMTIITLSNYKWILKNVIEFFNEYLCGYESILDVNKMEFFGLYQSFIDKKGIKSWDKISRISKNMELVYYDVRRDISTIFEKIYYFFELLDDKSKYFNERDKDIWDIRNLKIKIMGNNASRPRYTINFTKIKQPLIRELVKKYEYERLKTKKISTVFDDLKAINLFSDFLHVNYPEIESISDVDRNLVLEYFDYIELSKYSNSCKGQRKGSLKVFLNLCTLYNWDNAPDKKLIFENDYRKKVKIQPRIIPAYVLNQLVNVLDKIDPKIAKMIIILLNIGMRVNELCKLKTGCILQDTEFDYFITYYQSKTNTYNKIPIIEEVAKIIKEQEKENIENFKFKTKYIFTNDGEKPISQESFSYHLNKISFDKNICDLDGNLFRFKSHMFRHTVASNYANNSMSPQMIKMMLGHTAIKSVMSYIDLRDHYVMESIKDFIDIQDKSIRNRQFEKNNVSMEIKMIELQNGVCTKVGKGINCTHLNACLSCSMLKLNKNDLKFLQQYSLELDKEISNLRQNGYERLLEISLKSKNEIKFIIENVNKKEL